MWPSEYVELKRIEDLLVCGICYQFMDTSVVTLCSHNYCSLCIRKYLHYETQCPACFSETFEKDLRKNKVLDEIILHFSQVKKKLRKCPQSQQSVNNNTEHDGCDKLKLVKENSTVTNFTEKSVKDSPLVKNASSPCTPKSTLKSADSPRTSGQTNIALFFTPKSRKEIVQCENTKSVVCPVCKVPVPKSNINKHLDDCLKRQQKQPQVKIEEPKRKPLPKLVFNLMKDSVIRKKLKELGLSSQGDRKTLELRLQKYMILYNAECDKSSPRAVSELIRQFEEEENIEKRAQKACSSASRLQINRNTEQNVIDQERKKYLNANKSNFDHLIATIKKNRSKKSSVRRSLLEDSSSREPDSPHKRQAVGKKFKDTEDFDTNDFQPIRYDNVSIEPSDSNDSCPLQTYSSTDPLKCNVELSSGCENLDAGNCSPDLFSRTSEKIEFSNDSIKFGSDIDGQNVYLTNELENTKICDSPKSSSSVQKRFLMSKINAIQRIQSTSRSVENDEEIVKTEECEENNISEEQILQDLLQDDASSNDSVESKSNDEKRISTLDSFVNKIANNFSSFEKENISSPVIGPGNRLTRKRNRETVHSSAKTISKRVKGTKVAEQTLETAQSNNEDHVMSILHDTENGRSQKISRKKRNQQDSQAAAEKTTAVLRKSSRTRFASKVPLK